MATRKTTYAAHPAAGRWTKVIESMPKRTGKSLPEWIALLNKSGPSGKKERIEWLRTNHKLGMESAAIIAMKAAGESFEEPDPGSSVDQMFSGPKAHLRPLYEQLLRLAFAAGPGVSATPCKTMVSIRRKYVFAQLKPTTNSRIDLGFALRGVKVPASLIETGGLAKDDRITHRIPISSPGDIMPDVSKWLKIAYDRA